MNNILRNAQLAYDNREPDDSTPALEVTEVMNWIESAAQDLMAGADVTLNGRVIVGAFLLSDAVADYVVSRFQSGEDQDGMLGQALLAAMDYDSGKSASCARACFGPDKDWCVEAAIELITPFADDILAQIVEDNRYDD
jgi:hypothetical protein